MINNIRKTKKLYLLAPAAGILLFIIFYLVAAFLYPGGSQADQHSKGFSWMNNYWCNLLNERAINGNINPARRVAITGMFILCTSLALFWYYFTRMKKVKIYVRKLTRLSAFSSMCLGFFLFTRYHDMVINIAGLFAFVALLGTLSGLHTLQWRKLFRFGIINLILAGINDLIYYTNHFIEWLPLVQKISFIFFLSWICIINVALYKTAADDSMSLT